MGFSKRLSGTAGSGNWTIRAGLAWPGGIRLRADGASCVPFGAWREATSSGDGQISAVCSW